METLFYVLGAGLVVIALIFSAIGLRRDNFPSPMVLRVGVLFAFLVIAGTAYAAVELSQEEEAHRLEEENLEADAEQAAETEEAEAEGEVETPVPAEQGQGPAAPGEGGGAPAEADAGGQVFVENGCGSCHTLADQPDAVGAIGPNLDEALVDQDAASIEESIVDPSAEIASGFGDGIMPPDFGTTIPPDQLAALVAYLEQAAGASAN